MVRSKSDEKMVRRQKSEKEAHQMTFMENLGIAGVMKVKVMAELSLAIP